MTSIHEFRKYLKGDRWAEWVSLETDQRKNIPPPPFQKAVPDHTPLIDLTSPDQLSIGQTPLIDMIRQRRSRRQYVDDALSLEELSFLLWATQGVNAPSIVPEQDTSAWRTVPSAGARHPFETYLYVQRVAEVEPGLYRYLPLDHQLAQIETGDETAAKAVRAFGNDSFLLGSAVVFVWAVIPYRTEWRYGVLSHKVIAQDSGHVCQNLYLAAESIGAGACAIGAYNQKEVDALIDADGHDEFVTYMASVGRIAAEGVDS